MLVFWGEAAFSRFKLDQWQQQFAEQGIELTITNAVMVYFIQSTVELDEATQQHCQRLLVATTEPSVAHPNLIVVPRFGTISPWSSKATNIFHRCELTAIERVERGTVFEFTPELESFSPQQQHTILSVLHDRMTQTIIDSLTKAENLFLQHDPQPVETIPLLENGVNTLHKANQQFGLALSEDEINYLAENYKNLERDPTDVELMMFAQANSEHCRHKIFNADWKIDGIQQAESLFAMIKQTYAHHSDGVLSAYYDNAAVLAGDTGQRFISDPHSGEYRYHHEAIPFTIKVETHNHPTAIAPFAGAATGAGGEIRDGAATGRGAKPIAGLCGFSVSNLRLPNYSQPWEQHPGKPDNIASALDIMLQGPIGAASFNNEFGRPNLCGYFRTYEQQQADGQWFGYHKPIMIAGGISHIRAQHVDKQALAAQVKVIVLGGPAMQIGLGGGAASSMTSGQSTAALDFASVQRCNPEMERRCQAVIDRCWAMGESNPIVSIHDVGAGGLANAVPEIIEQSEMGGQFELRNIPNAEPGMSVLAIWCNESQERYVLAISAEHLASFELFAKRERCPYAVLGEVTADQQLVVTDNYFDNAPIDIPLNVIFGKPPKLTRDTQRIKHTLTALELDQIDIQQAAERVLQCPSVASKQFLITIGDRTVGGLTVRDQMVGPWQVPVADAAVTASSFYGNKGQAMAMGERAPIATINPAASARMALGEAITNIACAPVARLSDIKLSANWMASANTPGEDAALFDAVKTVSYDVCQPLDLTIPVGKDSLSMQCQWDKQRVTAPLSLVISAFAPVADTSRCLTPQLQTDVGETDLLLIDLGQGKNRLGASTLAQVYNQIGDIAPNLDQPLLLQTFFDFIQVLNQQKMILAYHDRSDGGLFASCCEMAFAGHVGIDIHCDELGVTPLEILFNEELGAVIQVRRQDLDVVLTQARDLGCDAYCHVFGTLNDNDTIRFHWQQQVLISAPRTQWQQLWSRTSYEMAALRDNAGCAEQEYAAISDPKQAGLNSKLTFSVDESQREHWHAMTQKPKVAILREQGVNGEVEMAAAFERAGFTPVDIHMSDIIDAGRSLEEFVGLAACGGFSYGDVLGAGRGWANTILANPNTSKIFADFFHRSETFTVGVCNGCQMLSQLTSLIPGADHWPQFKRNHAEQFEARLSLVEVTDSPSILLQGMQGSRLPVVVSHGEGRAQWPDGIPAAALSCLRYVDPDGKIATQYPANPNGSPDGITALTTTDGRVTIMMPHPERVFLNKQFSWHPADWQGEHSPWLQLFLNARVFVS